MCRYTIQSAKQQRSRYTYRRKLHVCYLLYLRSGLLFRRREFLLPFPPTLFDLYTFLLFNLLPVFKDCLFFSMLAVAAAPGEFVPISCLLDAAVVVGLLDVRSSS